MTSSPIDSYHNKHFPVVGRDTRVDLTKYTVQIHGRDIIDYEKLKTDNPALYEQIVQDELETDRNERKEYEELDGDYKKS